MKSNKLLAKSITLGLILAMPYGVVSAAQVTVSEDTTYVDGAYTDKDGVVINSGATLSGDKNSTDMVVSGKNQYFPRSLEVKGTISTANSLTVNGGTYVTSSGKISDIGTITLTNTVNSHTGGGLSVSLDNQGTIENVNTLVLGGRTTNTGTISVGAINKADDGTTLDIGNQAGGKIEVTGTVNVDQLGNSGEINAKVINLTASGNNGIHNQNSGKITAEEITGTGYIHNAGDTIDADTISITRDITNNAASTIITDKITADSLQNDGTIKASADALDNVLGELNVCKFTNSGTLTVTNANVSKSVTNSGTLTLDKIGSEENLVNIRNQSNGNLTVNGDVFGDFYSGGNNGNMTVEGTVTGYGYFSRNENASLTADKLIVTADGWNEINGAVDVDNMDVNGTMAVLTDKLDVADTTNINANLQFRAESGNSKLNNVNLNNASLQVGGESLTITGDMNVTGSEARFETWDYDNTNGDKKIEVQGNMTLEEGASLLITNSTGAGSSFEANNIILNEGSTLSNSERYASSLDDYTDAFNNFSVTTLNGTNATIVNDGNMDIGTLSGTDNNIEVHNLEKAQITIGTNNSTGLQVTGTSEATDNFDQNNILGSLQGLADTVEITNGNQLNNVVAEEGKIFGEITAEVDANGNVVAGSVIENGNIANEGITELANVAFMAWRAENDEMHQRMGELRSSNGEAGIWARMKRGESKYGDMDIKNQYSTYQLGYDEKVGDSNWYIGGAISRTEGKSSFATGSGENQSTGFTVYGTYVADDGQYVDLSAKYARLDNEFDVFGRSGIESTGDYRNNGYAFSAEYGKRIEAGNDFWVEPQVQLTYGHLSSANYTTSRNVRAAQDAMDSVVGRLGFAAGKDIGAGNVYVKASYLYDFDGETSVSMTDGKNSAVYEQDLGGGWFEVGIGTNINLSETSHLYFDVEKTYGGDIETPWQWNAGVRFDF